MAFSFETPQQPRQFSLSPKMLLGLGGIVAGVIVVGLIVFVIMRRSSVPVSQIQQQEQQSNQPSPSQGGTITEQPTTNGGSTVPTGIEYHNPSSPQLKLGDTHLLSAEEKAMYGFPPQVTVRSTIVRDEGGNLVPYLEIVSSQ